MKIAFIASEKLPVPPICGGAVQLYIEGVVPYLSKYHDITVFSASHNSLADKEIRGNVRYIRIPGKTPAEYLKNLMEVITEDFDLIHVFNRPLFLLELSEALPKVKFGLSLHYEKFASEKISDTQAKECVDKAKFITTLSNFIAEGVKDRVEGADKKLRVVYSGVEPNEYNTKWSREGKINEALLKERYGLQGYKVVLYVGRLSVKKGVHVLMRAMEYVMKEVPKVALVIVGGSGHGDNQPGRYFYKLQNMAQKLNGPIIFTGFLKPWEINKFYNLADVFVCPSQWQEPLARVHYEAMAAGLPIITTNRGGNAEIIYDHVNGLVLNEYKSPEIMSNYIKYLINNPILAKRLGKTGRRLVERKFCFRRVAHDLLQIF